MDIRDWKGRFSKVKKRKCPKPRSLPVTSDHSYVSKTAQQHPHDEESRASWLEGRRLVEFDVLLTNLKSCRACRMGPLTLTHCTIVGELQKGLSGYIYVKCVNPDCEHVNRVAYGKTHHNKRKGMPCFVVNTKLGTAMIDSLGGPVRVNNFLSALNLKPISDKNLKKMEERAGIVVEALATESAREAARDAYSKEMEDIANLESAEAQKGMDGLIEDLGVCPLPDASPSLRSILQAGSIMENDGWSDDEGGVVDSDSCVSTGRPADGDSDISIDRPADNDSDIHYCKQVEEGHNESVDCCILTTPACTEDVTGCTQEASLLRQQPDKPADTKSAKCRVRLSSRFPCTTRSGMSCAVDTAWHKRGFDSLTSHTFFMSKSAYGKKVLKTVVSHRTCGVCNWWRRNRSSQTVREHTCVRNHVGSARLMESKSGVQGVKELTQEGIRVEYIEGDGDNTLIARLKADLNVNMKKRFDRNHVVKNIGKNLYALRTKKDVKLSISVIIHIQLFYL